MVKIPRRTEDDGLPDGVSRELSPFWDFQQMPGGLLEHLLRYHHVAAAVLKCVPADKQRDTSLKLLDIGAGMCELYGVLRGVRFAGGSRLYYRGYEVDPWKVQRVRDELVGPDNIPKFELTECDITKIKKFPKADVCVSTEVLEHIVYEDCKKVLRRLAKACQYGVFTVPKPTLRRDNPWHLNEMSSPRFRKVAKKTGWKVIYEGSLGYRYDRKRDGSYLCKAVSRALRGLLEDTSDRRAGQVGFYVCKSTKF